MPHRGISCQDDFTLLQIQSQMDSYISYDKKNIVNDVMDGVNWMIPSCDTLRETQISRFFRYYLDI
jgi:hypothetical protein